MATTSNEKSREKYLFALFASQIQKAQSGSIVTKCFQVLCGVNKSTSLVGVVPGLLLTGQLPPGGQNGGQNGGCNHATYRCSIKIFL